MHEKIKLCVKYSGLGFWGNIKSGLAEEISEILIFSAVYPNGIYTQERSPQPSRLPNYIMLFKNCKENQENYELQFLQNTI